MNLDPKRYAWMAATLMAAGTARSDEVADLVESLQVPPRFAEHETDWAVDRETVTFRDIDGSRRVSWFLVKDGRGIVAAVPCQKGFPYSGTIYMQAFRPGQAPRRLDFPEGRWHAGSARGYELRTGALVPPAADGDRGTYDFKVEKDRVILTRRYEGMAEPGPPGRSPREPVRVRVNHRFVFRVDPRLGYVVEGTYDAWLADLPARWAWADAAGGRLTSPWPEDIDAYRVAVSTQGHSGMYHGYACNVHAFRRHLKSRPLCRDGGFVAFLNDRTGWSPATTVEAGVPVQLVIDPATGAHAMTLTGPPAARETADGMTRHVVRHRLLALPPAVTKHVWDTMRLFDEEERALLLRVGALDTFEEQPLPLTTRVRGHRIDAAVSDAVARSGKKAMAIRRTTLVGGPALYLEADRRYRLACRMRLVTPADDRGQVAAGVSLRMLDRPGGRPVGDAVTASIDPLDADWQKVTLDLRAADWGPAAQIEFTVRGGTLYVDDFEFRPK